MSFLLFNLFFFSALRSHVFCSHPHSPSQLYQAQHHHPRPAHCLQPCSCELIKWDDLWPAVTDHYEANMYGPAVGKHRHRRTDAGSPRYRSIYVWENDILHQNCLHVSEKSPEVVKAAHHNHNIRTIIPSICEVNKQPEKVVSLWLPLCLSVLPRQSVCIYWLAFS